MSVDPKAWRKTMYGNYSANFNNREEGNDIVKYKLFEQIYNPYLPSAETGDILDLGCGKGEWLLWLKNKKFHNLTGVDLSAEELEIAAARGLKVYQDHVLDFLVKHPNHFSLIHAKDLIEHLDKNELVDLGHAVLKSLKPGGIFIASTFNAQAPLASTTRYGDFTHESGFTLTSITQWLSACGFHEVFAKGYHSCPMSLKGIIRKILYAFLAKIAEFIVTLRHGKNSQTSCLPDLIVVAKKSNTPIFQ